MAHQLDEEQLLDGLNPAQRAAVTSPASVLQILAPPGSGKTKTLTARVAYLLANKGYKPWNVIVATFTVKAAKEMKERIGKLIGNGLESRLILGTFHSIARRYLVRYGHHIGLKKDFSICDSNDSLALIKRIMKRNDFRSPDAYSVRSRISNHKARAKPLPTPKTSGYISSYDQQFIQIYHEYQDALERSTSLDYDDLLIRCVELLEAHPKCVSNVDVVLVDEFQDTNIVQFNLMRLFASRRSRICTVGDPDQSIYGWRAAEIKNLSRMKECYPDLHTVLLEENYRSSGAILLSALAVIEQDTSRPAKPLLPTHGTGTQSVFRTLRDAGDEGEWIATEIVRVRAMTAGLIALKDIAILLRSAALSRSIENALTQADIPYKMVGGLRFYDRWEVKVVLDYLRVICQPDNSEALSRVINVPPRRIGEKTIKGLLDEADEKKLTLFTLVRRAIGGNIITTTKITKACSNSLTAVTGLILDARKRLNEPLGRDNSLVQIIEGLLAKLSFKDHIAKAHPEDHEGRWANVQELLAQASEYSKIPAETFDEEQALPEIAGLAQSSSSSAVAESLTQFLSNVALSSEVMANEDDNNGEPRDELTIATIHSAKGLEWPVVFIPSVCDGVLPHSRSEDHDEERRLLYVAMTRAKALLYLSYFRESSWGDGNDESSFINYSVKEHIAAQGPKLPYEVVQSMSQILGRECPAETSILDACKDLPSLEDDLWDERGRFNYEGHQRKRPRFEQAGGNSKGTYQDLNGQWQQRAPTTMTQLGSQGHPAPQFTTASAHLRENPTTASTSKGNRSTQPGSKQQKAPLERPQTTIESLAAKLSASDPASSQKSTSSQKSASSQKASQGPPRGIAPALASRTMPRGESLVLPRPKSSFSPHAGAQSRPYVFLSSSPAPDCKENVAPSGSGGADEAAGVGDESLPSLDEVLKGTAEVVPATKAKAKKTLGVRRGVGTRSGAGNVTKEFKVQRPKKRKSDEC